jgi:hypothetical protein
VPRFDGVVCALGADMEGLPDLKGFSVGTTTSRGKDDRSTDWR